MKLEIGADLTNILSFVITSTTFSLSANNLSPGGLATLPSSKQQVLVLKSILLLFIQKLCLLPVFLPVLGI